MMMPVENTTTINTNSAKRLYNRLKWLSFALAGVEVLFCLILIEIGTVYIEGKSGVVPNFLVFPFLFFAAIAPILWIVAMVWSVVLVKWRALWLLLGAPFILGGACYFFVMAMWVGYANYCNAAQPLIKLYTVDHNGHFVYSSMVSACAGP